MTELEELKLKESALKAELHAVKNRRFKLECEEIRKYYKIEIGSKILYNAIEYEVKGFSDNYPEHYILARRINSRSNHFKHIYNLNELKIL